MTLRTSQMRTLANTATLIKMEKAPAREVAADQYDGRIADTDGDRKATLMRTLTLMSPISALSLPSVEAKRQQLTGFRYDGLTKVLYLLLADCCSWTTDTCVSSNLSGATGYPPQHQGHLRNLSLIISGSCYRNMGGSIPRDLSQFHHSLEFSWTLLEL